MKKTPILIEILVYSLFYRTTFGITVKGLECSFDRAGQIHV